MRVVFATKSYLIIGMMAALPLFLLPCRASAVRNASPQLTQLLAEAADETAELARDADDAESLIHNDANWETHAEALDRVKEHVNNMGRIIGQLTQSRTSGSELQEEAIDRILPLLKQLADNTTAAINYLNQNKTRPLSVPYTEYLQDNADTAHQLASTVSDLFEYEKSMTKIAQLRNKLELNGQQANN